MDLLLSGCLEDFKMYQILTDSCCDLPYEVLEENNVDFISMYVSIDGT